MKILVINGVNLNLTGQRQPKVYGSQSLADIEKELISYGNEMGVEIACVQSNIEGEIVNFIHSARKAYDGIIINAGAYSHYSYAICDALIAAEVCAVEVHFSNIFSRDEFRKNSVIAPACVGSICGLGKFGYFAAVDYFLRRNKNG